MPVVLSEGEREQLQAWARRPMSAQAMALRSRIVLACESDSSNTQIAQDLGITRGMVTKWRSRFAADRLDGLLDEPRPEAPSPEVVGDDQIKELIGHTGIDAERCHALVDPVDGRTPGLIAVDGLSRVAGIWAGFAAARTSGAALSVSGNDRCSSTKTRCRRVSSPGLRRRNDREPGDLLWRQMHCQALRLIRVRHRCTQ